MTLTRICSEVETECRCTADTGHDGPHLCDCGGSWLWVDGEFRAYTLPGTARPGLFGDFARDLDSLFLGGPTDV